MQSNQTDIFRDDSQQLQFAELCNALYERELQTLAQSGNLSLLQRRLKGLTHHIKRIAASMLQHDGPLQLDIHNASWQAKQAPHCPRNDNPTDTQAWFKQHLCLGLPVPVWQHQTGIEYLELDCIDKFDLAEGRLHLNKNGWFMLDGSPVSENSQQRALLVPKKATLSAACCGHSWKQGHRFHPHTLSLRELRLVSQINWKNSKIPA
ncbi:hypothetical protein KJY73_15215 [Bowmanella sp. Y26]|uniref:hypothetical protein n=1 Tax=Bowmanella yangjiangensis TaxID=2811230 RepID=UPI001BDBF271|nr:hypothetical protein [Bowmanella yangjiangensis]MBT1064942.1 hypothetical protein [Bowmanella yangjiangensis]